MPGTGRSTGGAAVGRRGRKIRNNVKLSSRFSAERRLHVFAPACRLQSIGGGVRACGEYVKSWGCLVRGETRRKSPLSLPRTPLFYAERERGAGGAALPSGISRRNVVTTHIPLPGSGTLPPLFYAERERGAGGAALPSGISRRNVVTTHIPLPGSGTLPPLFCAERELAKRREAGGDKKNSSEI